MYNIESGNMKGRKTKGKIKNNRKMGSDPVPSGNWVRSGDCTHRRLPDGIRSSAKLVYWLYPSDLCITI